MPAKKVTKSMIEDQEATIRVECTKLNNLKRQYAEQECPFKVGDTVEFKKSYGRNEPCKMKVETITFPKYSFQGSWRVRGPNIKKDGTLGKKTLEYCQSDHNDQDWIKKRR